MSEESKPDFEKLTLANVGHGCAEEIFQRGIKEVLANVHDINTEPDAKRKLTLEFTFEPTADRSLTDITVGLKLKLAPIHAAQAHAFLHEERGTLKALHHRPKQEEIFDGAKVTPLQSAKKE